MPRRIPLPLCLEADIFEKAALGLCQPISFSDIKKAADWIDRHNHRICNCPDIHALLIDAYHEMLPIPPVAGRQLMAVLAATGYVLHQLANNLGFTRYSSIEIDLTRQFLAKTAYLMRTSPLTI